MRSSATAEDLPTASFAGQHESFLNVRGAKDLFEACRRCFASIFTDRAISYRIDNGFDHFKVALSVGVMKMVRSDLAASGVIFTLDTESGFRDVVFVTGVYGLGETIVQGTVDPDEFYVHKPTLRQGYRVRAAPPARRQANPHDLRARRMAARERLTFRRPSAGAFLHLRCGRAELADYRDARSRTTIPTSAGHPMPMDIEWAKDGADGRLYIIQARPETVASQRTPTAFETYALKATGTVSWSPVARSEKKSPPGRTRGIADARGSRSFQARRDSGRAGRPARIGSRS